MASCRVWQPFAVSWVCVPGPARSTHGGDRTAGNCGRGEEIRRRVFAAAPCNIPGVRKKVESTSEMEKGGDTGDISLLFFLAGANFWAILGHFWAILAILGPFLQF